MAEVAERRTVNPKVLGWNLTKDKIGHKSGGFEIFTPFCYKLRLVLGFFPVQNMNFNEGVYSYEILITYDRRYME